MDTITKKPARAPERPVELTSVKQGHFYLVRYRKGQEEAVADVLARWANDPDLDFSWGDACTLGDQLDLPPNEPLAAPRGLFIGMAVGVAFWGVVFAAVWGWR